MKVLLLIYLYNFLDLRQACDIIKADYQELNRTYHQQWLDDDIFAKEITNHKFSTANGKMPTSIKSIRCKICESQLTAKNDSLNVLQILYTNQTSVLSNLTTYYNLCEGARSSLRSLDLQKFRNENPQTFVALMFLVTFASIGGAAVLFLLISCLVYYRRPIWNGFSHLKRFCAQVPESSILKKRSVVPGKTGSDLPKDEATDEPKASTSTVTDLPASTSRAAKEDLNTSWKKGDVSTEEPTVKIDRI